MQISAKTDYACRALLELSLHWPSTNPLHMSAISERQKIPIKFLTQILIILRQLGYVESVRGKHGGYRLTKSPKKILLADVLRGMGDFKSFEGRAPGNGTGTMLPIWRTVEKKLENALSTVNFESICTNTRKVDKILTFEI